MIFARLISSHIRAIVACAKPELKATNFKTGGRLVKWQEQLKNSKKIRV